MSEQKHTSRVTAMNTLFHVMYANERIGQSLTFDFILQVFQEIDKTLLTNDPAAEIERLRAELAEAKRGETFWAQVASAATEETAKVEADRAALLAFIDGEIEPLEDAGFSVDADRYREAITKHGGQRAEEKDHVS